MATVTTTLTAIGNLTEEGTSRTIQAGGMKVHYHDVGQGEPVIFLHSYGPGTTAWITFYKNLPVLSKHFRCILMDMPNFGRTGPVVYNAPVHNFQAQTARDLMDALSIKKAHIVGNSQGGQSAMVFAMKYPDRINKLVFGDGHIGQLSGDNIYLMANRPSEGSRATREVTQNPTRENFRRYLRAHLDDEALVTDDLVEYIYQNHTSHPDHVEARSKTPSVPYTLDGAAPVVKAPTLIIWGRYDRMCVFELGIAALNRIDTARMTLLNKCGHWPPFEKPDEYSAHVLNFLKGEWA